MRKSIPFLSLISFSIPVISLAQQKHPITVEDMWKVGRVSDPQVSPDGGTIGYVVTRYNMDGNKGTSSIFLVSIDGKNVRELNTGMKSSNDPVWSPDGKSWVRNSWLMVG